MQPPQPPHRPDPWDSTPARGPYERHQVPPRDDRYDPHDRSAPGHFSGEPAGHAPGQVPGHFTGEFPGPPPEEAPGPEPGYVPRRSRGAHRAPAQSTGEIPGYLDEESPYGDARYGPEEDEQPRRRDAFDVEGTLGIGGDLDRAFAGARRGRIGAMVIGIGSFGAVAITGVVAFIIVLSGGPEGDIPLDGPATMSAGPSAGTEPEEVRGNGKFHRASAGPAPTVTAQRSLRYVVEVEGGLGQRPATFAQQVHTVLTASRGWQAGGQYSFQRVQSKPFDFAVRLASPPTTDQMCARFGLDTGGTENCTGGVQILLNLNRWLQPAPPFTSAGQHRAYVLNHMVGQRLGHARVQCPGPGQTAPVMQAQRDLSGCRANAWPYDAQGNLVTGPPAS